MRAKEFIIEYKSEAAINAIMNTFGNKLQQKLTQDLQIPQNKSVFGEEVDVRKLLDFIIKTDPTQKSIYVNWIINRYLAGDFRYLEDIPKVTETLTFYEKVKAKLPQEQRDINYFKSFSQLDGLIDSMKEKQIDTTSNREKERQLEKEMIDKGEVEIYYNSPDIKIIIPKSKRASCYYGRNTKWCTAANENNMFSDYNKRGNLYILLFKKDNIRWQFHFQSHQFMDEKDESLSAKQVQSVGHLFPNTFIHPNASEELQLMAVKQNPYAIEYIKNPSEELQLMAVKQNPYAIEYIKNPSEELQLMAVKQNPYAIQYIKNPSEELQLMAVKQAGWAIRYIKNPSEELQLMAVKQNPYAIQCIKNPSEELQLMAVKQAGNAIEYIENPSERVKALAKSKGYKR